MTVYDDNFYKNITGSRVESSKVILKLIFNILNPNSVLDVGCGRGVWLKTAKELGAEIVYGIDGEWNEGKMIDEKIFYKPVDLNQNFSLDKKFDLTICLEVAEHLTNEASQNLIFSLINTSNTILFSSAFYYQGGIAHINENLHSYWADLFLKNNFLPFDIVRPITWGNEKISFWYRQNTFLYVKKNSIEFEKLSKKFSYLENNKFMDCIHPEMYFRRVQSQGIKHHLKQIAKQLKKRFF